MYRGTGSVYDPETENYFYDIGYSYIVDRFEMGASIGATEEEVDEAIGDDAHKKCFQDDQSVICSGSNLEDIYAAKGTIMYFSGYGAALIFMSKSQRTPDQVSL